MSDAASSETAKESTVLFLGAGASVPFGYPITSGIMALILDGLKAETLFKQVSPRKAKEFANACHVTAFSVELESRDPKFLMKLLLDRLNILYPGLEIQCREKLPNITDVLSLVDYLLLQDEAVSPRFQPKFLQEIRELLERALMDVLSNPIGTEKVLKEQKRFNKLMRWILSRKKHGGEPVTVITTNYDTLIDQAIYERFKYPVGKEEERNVKVAKSVECGFPWRDAYQPYDVVHYPVSQPQVRLYKLHGSLNWLKCQLCGHIYINTFSEIYDLAYMNVLHEVNSCHCDHGPLRPVIVAPSMVRNIREPNLLAIWQRSLEALRTATRWVMIGYSLPKEDLAIRSILMRADRGQATDKQIDVFQINRDAESNYRLLFPDCHYHLGGMEAFIDSL